MKVLRDTKRMTITNIDTFLTIYRSKSIQTPALGAFCIMTLQRMKITEVNDKKTRKDFLDVARILYRDDANWICPLDNDIEAVFDPKKNNFHQHGKCTRWIMTDDNGRLTGRVAAFINDKKAYNYEQPTGGM